MKNKKAQLGDMTMFLAFLTLLIIIGGGIAAGVYIFFGSGYDFRQVDADILNYKIRTCLINSELDETNFKEDLYQTCKLNKNITEEVLVLRIKKETKTLISLNNPQGCLLEGAKENKAFPKCTESILTKNQITYTILTGSNQKSRRQFG